MLLTKGLLISYLLFLVNPSHQAELEKVISWLLKKCFGGEKIELSCI
jgi:hypothetical protein